MSSMDTTAAAAALTADILASAAKGGDDHAARLLAQDAPAEPVAAPAPPVSSPPPAAAAAPTIESVDVSGYVEAADANLQQAAVDAAAALPDFTPQPDDELDALLAEASVEDEVEAEIQAEAEEYGETYDPDEARRIKTLEKRAEFLEKQLVAKSKKDWVAENLRKYPLLATYFADEVKGIDATSRRGFAKAAARMNDHYAKALAQPLADIEALKAAAKQEAKAEARQEAAQQWGLPAQDPTSAANADTAVAVALKKAREERAPLEERLKILAGFVPKT